jgi:hypothetical protein
LPEKKFTWKATNKITSVQENANCKWETVVEPLRVVLTHVCQHLNKKWMNWTARRSEGGGCVTQNFNKA